MVLEERGNFGGNFKTPESSNANNGESLQVRKSAFQPYKPSVTVLTNLQRGNIKAQTANQEPNELSIFQLAAKGELSESLIAEVNINVFDQETEGLTPLMWACAYCQAHTVKHLLAAGAEVNLWNSKGQTALHYATKSGCPEIVKLLLASGANVNHTDEQGNSALIFAANSNQPQILSMLLANGANVAFCNKQREGSHHIAVRLKHIEIQYLLENYMKQCLSGRYDEK